MLGKETLKRFEEECLQDVFDLLREFETTKRAIQPDSSGATKIRLPLSLQTMKIEETKQEMKGSNFRQELMKTLMSKDYGDMITVKDNRMRLEPSVALGMFEYSISHICNHIRELLYDFEDIDTILVVGGFSECAVVQDGIKKEFKRKRVIFPPEPGLTVLRGAVLCGHNPGIIASRKAKFTYGVRSSEAFDAAKHPASSRKVINGVSFCSDVFRVLVKQGTEVSTGHRITEIQSPSSSDERNINIELFLSTDPQPKLVSDPTCMNIGKMQVRLPKGKTNEERAYETSYIFGEIEIMVKVKHLKSEECFSQYFSFM